MSLTDAISKGLTADDARAVMEFEKMRFEFSWRHFDIHARQRTQMFHFFIILTPFILGGCLILFREKATLGLMPALIAASIGTVLSAAFFGLDRRNKQLIRTAERALKLLETQFLYTDFRPLIVPGGHYLGVMTTEDEENNKRWCWWMRSHSCLIGLVYWMAFLLYVGIIVYLLSKDGMSFR